MQYKTYRDKDGTIRTLSGSMGAVGMDQGKDSTEVGGFVKNPVTKKPFLGVSLERDKKKKKTRLSIGYNGKPAFNKEF
jgi:hypothetical protein